MDVSQREENDQTKPNRVLAMFPFFNEEQKLSQMAPRLSHEMVELFIGVNDGSTDRGPEILRHHGIAVIDQDYRRGVGSWLRSVTRLRNPGRHGR